MRAFELSPLIVKELGGMSRRGWTYLIRTFYVILTAIPVYAVAAPALHATASVALVAVMVLRLRALAGGR